MRRRIFRTMSAAILITALLLGALWALVIRNQFSVEIKAALRQQRVSIINQDGSVDFDNQADERAMDNHLDRPEVREAFDKGAGESQRLSSTSHEMTSYFAQRMDDGRVLRLALTTASMLRMLLRFLPWVLLCLALVLLVSFLIARRLTKSIVAPINSADPEDAGALVYDELAPFLSKIQQQKREIKHQMARLCERSDTIAAIMADMKEGLILTDARGVVLSANASAQALLPGTEPGSDMMIVCRDLAFAQGLSRCLQGQGEGVRMQLSGRVFDVHLNPVAGSGAVILLVDATEKSAAEDQRREFSANVSHELKTPLTTISALSEMVAGGMAQGEDVRVFAGRIHAQSQRLIRIIDDIIHLSAFDEGRQGREAQAVELLSLGEGVMDSLREGARQRGVRLDIQGEPVSVMGNARMLDELLFNLLDNAIRYNREGGSASLFISTGPQEATIRVADTGIGIPMDAQQRVFERFYRVDKSRSKDTGGTGLGLSIVKHVVEHHGGRIELVSRLGEGTQISVHLPL